MKNATVPAPAPRVQAALNVLRARGERVTRVRQAVIEVLDGTVEHLDADQIVGQAAASAPGVHRASVYRALATLGDLGLVTHTHIGGSAAVYHLSIDLPETPVETQSHAHLQCSSCHRVIDIPVAVLDPLVARVERDLGFRLEPQHTALLGICADCRPD
jgi:Fur family transcriptional regulator, ferric uptake regulator